MVKPEPVAPPPKVETTTIPIEATTDIDKLKVWWKQKLQNVPQEVRSSNAVALMRSARPKDVEQDVVILSFKWKIHKENLEQPENQRIAEKVLSNFLGKPCRLRCVVEEGGNHLVDAARKAAEELSREGK